MNKEFRTWVLNDAGKASAKMITEVFDALLDGLHSVCPDGSREFAIARTKLEEACFFAKKAMASDPANQEVAINEFGDEVPAEGTCG